MDTDTTSARLTLLVIYTDRLEECRTFYAASGLDFRRERHGGGPEHYAAVLPDGTVFELYPAKDDRRTGTIRLGFSAGSRDTRSAAGRHLLRDPEGRTVEVRAA